MLYIRVRTCVCTCTQSYLRTYISIQWNLSIVDTTGPRKSAVISQRLICTQKVQCTLLGPQKLTWIREVSLFQPCPFTVAYPGGGCAQGVWAPPSGSWATIFSSLPKRLLLLILTNLPSSSRKHSVYVLSLHSPPLHNRRNIATTCSQHHDAHGGTSSFNESGCG